MISAITIAACRDELEKIATETCAAHPHTKSDTVYKDVAKKFPELAKGKEKDGGMEAGPQTSGVQPLPGMARGGPPGGMGMQAGLGGA